MKLGLEPVTAPAGTQIRLVVATRVTVRRTRFGVFAQAEKTPIAVVFGHGAASRLAGLDATPLAPRDLGLAALSDLERESATR